jgi:putative DNA primase/helicase
MEDTMTLMDFKARAADIKARARGRWREILLTHGIEERYLGRRHGPCPLCSTDSKGDRFRFTDRFGNGEYICSPGGNGCGTGDGFRLLMQYHNWDFKTALDKVAECVGSAAPLAYKPGGGRSNSAKEKTTLQTIWDESKPLTRGDPASRYLENRGFVLASHPKCLRYHPALDYREDDGNGKSHLLGKHPGLVARVEDVDGTKPLGLHRTYLTANGTKADVREPKKSLGKIAGGVIRLFPVDRELGVAEGIETALGASLLFDLPVWPTLSSGNMEKLDLPDAVQKLHIFADADQGFAGFKAAATLASRAANGHLRRIKREVALHLIATMNGRHAVRTYRSTDPAVDFADLWCMRAREQQAA